MPDQTPMDYSNQARKDAIKRLISQQSEIKDTIVTRPAVSEKETPEQAHRNYLLVRNNESQIGAMVEHAKGQGGIRAVIADLKDGERKLQRRDA